MEQIAAADGTIREVSKGIAGLKKYFSTQWLLLNPPSGVQSDFHTRRFRPCNQTGPPLDHNAIRIEENDGIASCLI